MNERIEYVGADGTMKTGFNSLAPIQEEELRRHLSNCEVIRSHCHDCWRLYTNIGHKAYQKALLGEDLYDDG